MQETTQRPMIEVRNLRKEYPVGDETVVALKRINLQIARGEICCIFGTSGSGKSTLLNQLAGMEKPTRGGVKIGGVLVSALNEDQLAAFRQKHLGFVFQSYNLLPGLTAAENVALPLMFRGVDEKARMKAARQMLARVGLGHRMDHFPGQMSGGQQQRVGIARALATDPEIIFFDEPTSALDPELIGEVLAVMRQLAEEGRTMLVVTHEMNFARTVSSKVLFMENGAVLEAGPSREFFANPGEERARAFLRTLNGETALEPR